MDEVPNLAVVIDGSHGVDDAMLPNGRIHSADKGVADDDRAGGGLPEEQRPEDVAKPRYPRDDVLSGLIVPNGDEAIFLEILRLPRVLGVSVVNDARLEPSHHVPDYLPVTAVAVDPHSASISALSSSTERRIVEG